MSQSVITECHVPQTINQNDPVFQQTKLTWIIQYQISAAIGIVNCTMRLKRRFNALALSE